MKPKVLFGLRVIEWGSLICATVLLVLSETYHPRMNFAFGLLTLSWIARWAQKRRFTRSTPVDFPILLFIISALVALWAAPNQPAGFVRFCLFLTTISLFYTLVNSDFRALEIFSNGLIALAGVIGVFLASQIDWAQGMARFEVTEKIALWLNDLIPHFGLNLPHLNAIRNISASFLALSLTIAFARFIVGIRKDKSSGNLRIFPGRASLSVNYWMAGLGFVLVFVGLSLTESRTPWMVFALMLALWIWWWLTNILSIRLSLPRAKFFLVSLGVVVTLAGLIVIRQPQFLSVITKIPGPKDYLNRAEIYSQSWRLAQDTPLTGGGLAAYPALYSSYIRVIPHNAFLSEDTGNNAYLNILVEQGWLGALSYIILLGSSLILAVQRYDRTENEYRSFVIAGIFGILFVLFHGFVHAALVGTRAIPALLIPAGLALSGSEKNPDSAIVNKNYLELSGVHGLDRIRKVTFAVALAAATIAMLLAFRKPILSIWFSNLGAVRMAKIELSDFPSGKWDDGSNIAALSEARDLFRKALPCNPSNRTANHRLGLIALLGRDFPAAENYLERAHRLDLKHRGIRKALGYSYAWAGQPQRAIPLLVEIPEAKGEMRIFIRWWGTQKQVELSGRAARMLMFLEAAVSQLKETSYP